MIDTNVTHIGNTTNKNPFMTPTTITPTWNNGSTGYHYVSANLSAMINNSNSNFNESLTFAENGSFIFWPGFCSNLGHPGLFWSSSLTVDTARPGLPRCFQDIVLIGLPALVLLMATPFWIMHLAGKSTRHGTCSFSYMNATKQIITLLLVAAKVLELVVLHTEHVSIPPAAWVGAAIRISTLLLCLSLSRWEFRKGEHSSGIMFWFWTLMFLTDGVMLYSSINDSRHGLTDMLLASPVAQFLLTSLLLLIHLFPDLGARRGHRKTGRGYSLLENENEAESLLTEKKGGDATNQENPIPELWASYLSRIMHTWIMPVLYLGFKRGLGPGGQHLYDLRPDMGAERLNTRFHEKWLESSPHRDILRHRLDDPDPTSGRLKTWQTSSSIHRAIWKTFGLHYSTLAIYEILNTILTFIRPIIQSALIGYVQSETSYAWQGYMYATVLFVATILRGVVLQMFFNYKQTVAIKMRSVLMAAVYRKSLLLANRARRIYSVGDIVNLMAVDSNIASTCACFFHNLWASPFNILIAVILLWRYLGVSCLVGLAALIIMMSANGIITNLMKQMQKHMMREKDRRTGLTSEVLNGMKVLKLYAWEGAFRDRLERIRDRELSYVFKSSIYYAITVINFTSAPIIFAVTAFTAYSMSSVDGVMSAQVAFVSISLLGSITRPLSALPTSINYVIMGNVSLDRLGKFLNSEELETDIFEHISKYGHAITLRNASFSWEGQGEPDIIHNVDLDIKVGSLTCVVGSVGSGKTSLLSALLGELSKNGGEVTKQGSIAYVPQEAWLLNNTLENNIVFGKPLHRGRYEQVVGVCALEADIDILPAGDQTEIGEKGINISGGQKQRISLARAVYADRDIYLLDDPLSAVDAHVGKTMYNEVIGPTGLLRNKTRILVTHGVTYLPKADQIVVMRQGRISEVGTYKELMEQDGEFAEFISTFLGDPTSDVESDEETVEIMEELELPRDCFSDHELPMSDPESAGPLRLRRTTKRRRIPVKPLRKETPVSECPDGRKLVTEEDAAEGEVKFSVLKDYFSAAGNGLISIVLCTLVLQVVTELSGSVWLSWWSDDSSTEMQNKTTMSTTARVTTYAGLGLASTLVVTIQSIAAAFACVSASRVLGAGLLRRIVHAPMSFFDTTPTGRILNRFSQDINIMDTSIRMNLANVFRGVTSLVTTCLAISYSTPLFVLVLVPIAICYYFLQRFYIVTANQMRRIVSVRTSPVYSHFGATVAGASSVRAYGRQSDFVAESNRMIDSMQAAKYPGNILDRWLAVWLEVLGGFVVLFAALFAVIEKGHISGGVVGLSIAYALQITDRLAIFLRNTSEFENSIVCVERIAEYSRVEQERPWRILSHRPPSNWPHTGRIALQNYSIRYRPGLDLVLKNLDCAIDGGEKIGIVGRTGAGKSSITLGLFRLIEAAQGSILIDGVDTSKIGLHDLRSKITIIPQDPTLFSGTLRMNVDPLEERSDVAIWDSLGHAHLQSFVADLEGGLDHEVQEGGTNFSVGQRQLVCLARALLRKTKILVLDEATAAIDLETDSLIQNTIRQEFADCTVLTVAHRLNTIMDYDRVMVLSLGKIQEFGPPSTLLLKPNGSFRAMCADAGIFGTANILS